MSKAFDTLSTEEFEQLIDQFIEREDPDALSLQALDEAARLKFTDMATSGVEVTDEMTVNFSFPCSS